MKTIRIIPILVLFAVVCASQIKVDFVSENSNSIRVPVPEGAFHMIDIQNTLLSSDTENDDSFSKKTPEKESVRTAWFKFENALEYEQFRKLWDINSPAQSAESRAPLQEQTPLTKDLFEKCLVTASILRIKGEYAKFFFKNMVKYGLLGAHSADILSLEILSEYNLSHNTFWDLLYAFLDQIDFDYRIIDYPCTGQTVLRIESSNVWSKQIDKEYAGMSQTTGMRTVLYSRLGPEGTQKKKRNEAVLSWLLQNMGGSSVDIQYSTSLFSEDIGEISHTIQSFTKENEKGACLCVEGLTFNVECSNSASLLLALHLVPDLSRLELSIIPSYTFDAELSSLARSITSCESLRALKITGMLLESAAVSILVEGLPILEHLSLPCDILDDTAIDNLKKCTHLESLEVDGDIQPSTTVQALVSYLPFLKELSIMCKPLEPAAAESFQACTQLEKLKMRGLCQPSAVVQALVRHLPFLKELKIECMSLEPAAVKTFELCTQLEKLKMRGRCQPSAVVQALVTHLPFLKELKIECMSLEPAAVKSFKACAQLKKLKMWGWCQPSTVVQALIARLPSLKKLKVKFEGIDPAVAKSFEACVRLEKLEINGEGTSSFLIKLLEVLPLLQDLKIRIDMPDIPLAYALRKCHSLRSLELNADFYCSKFLASYLQNPLPKLKFLKLYNVNESPSYTKEDKIAVEKARAEGIRISWL